MGIGGGRGLRRAGVATVCADARSGAARWHEAVLLLFNTTRTLSGPPSTGAAIAMDGGVTDTAGGLGRRGVPRTGAAPGAGSVPTLDAVYYTLELYCNISTPWSAGAQTQHKDKRFCFRR